MGVDYKSLDYIVIYIESCIWHAEYSKKPKKKYKIFGVREFSPENYKGKKAFIESSPVDSVSWC